MDRETEVVGTEAECFDATSADYTSCLIANRLRPHACSEMGYPTYGLMSCGG